MVEYNFLNFTSVVEAFKYHHNRDPFSHVVIDNFFTAETAQQLSKDFFAFDSDKWKSTKGNSKNCNNWNNFPKLTYTVFSYLCGEDFTRFLQGILGTTRLYPDPGLQNAGLYITGSSKKTKPKIDDIVHTKLNLQKTLNLVVYLSTDIKEEYGGHLGLWSCNEENQTPNKLVTEIAPVFNRAVLFYTDKNSFYNTSRSIKVPEKVYKKTITLQYLQEI